MKKTIAYEIELTTSRKRIGFNLLYDEHFKVTYVIGTIPNSPSGHQLTTPDEKNVCIIANITEYPTTV